MNTLRKLRREMDIIVSEVQSIIANENSQNFLFVDIGQYIYFRCKIQSSFLTQTIIKYTNV